MSRVLIAACALAVLAGGCTVQPYEAEPVTPQQRLERLERQQRAEAERQRLCAMMDRDTERYARDCRRPGDPDR